MLLDLPPELINLIVGHLAPPWEDPEIDDAESCECVPQEDPNRQLVLFNTEGLPKASETDVSPFGVAHPYIARCIVDGGWQGVVDSFFMVYKQDLGIITSVPKELQVMVSKINFTIYWYRPPAECLTGMSRATTAQLPTLQSLVREFPTALRLDIDIDDESRNPYLLDSLFVESSTDTGGSLAQTEGRSPDLPCQIAVLVLTSFDAITLLASALPLQLLKQLYITEPLTISARPHAEDVDEYRASLDQLETVAVVWRSLESIQVCIRVLLDWCGEHDDLAIWNAWQIALTSLFRAFQSNPSCKIGLCITYQFETAAVIPLDQTFQRLPNGTHTLCNRMAPTDESAVRAFLSQDTGRSIPRFNLSINHLAEGAELEELLKVSYHPTLTDPSLVSTVPPAEGILESTYYWERLEEIYGKAKDEYF